VAAIESGRQVAEMADVYLRFAFVTKLDPHFPHSLKDVACRYHGARTIHLGLFWNSFEDKGLCGSAGRKVSLIVAEEK
jgi:hypothetical protein